jgi:hypothetical protein
MPTFIVQAHSGWRYIVLLIIVIVIIRALIGWLGKQKWSNLDTNLMLASRVSLYIQVVLGVLTYIVVQKWAAGFGFIGSHIIPAILAVGAVEFGAARAKKSSGNKKFMFAFIGFVIAIVLVYGALVTVGGLFA